MNFDFPTEIIRTDRIKSASIKVEDGKVRIIVPQTLSELRIEALVKTRKVWIRRKIKTQTETIQPKRKEYVNGESFTYLGRCYRLKRIKNDAEVVKLKNGYFLVPIENDTAGATFETHIRNSLKQWYQTRARVKLKEKTMRYASIIGVSPKSVQIKDYKSRWGSCSSDGVISYNWRIIIAPHHIVDYIVVHELCHLLEHNHGSQYWKHVEHVIPNYMGCREWLKLNGSNLTL